MSEPLPEGQQPLMQQPETPAEPTEPEVEYAQIPVEEYEQLKQLAQFAPELTSLANYAQQLPQEPDPQQQQGPQLDWLDPESQQQLDAYIDQRISPIQQYTQEQQLAEASEQARDILNDHLKTQGFEYMNDASADRALELANHYVAEEQARYGQGIEAAEAAISRAADEVRAWEQAVGQAYAEQQGQHVQRVMQAPQQPQQSGTPAAQTLTTTPGGPQAVLQKYFGGGG